MPLYKRAPITEAIIEIRFADPITESDTEKLRDRLKSSYPIAEKMQHPHITMPGPGGVPNVKMMIGYKLSSMDRADVSIAGPFAMGCSRLAPYGEWLHFFERAKQDWLSFHKILGYRKIARLGLRYINRLDIPTDSPKIKLEDYLNVYPAYPDQDNEFLKAMNDFNMQLAAPIGDGYHLVINSANSPPAMLGHISILLDIDIGKDNPPQKDADIWGSFEEMRLLKNKVFEASITEPSRKLFQI